MNEIGVAVLGKFDALYLSARRGRRLMHFPELSFPAVFSRNELRQWIAKIDDPALRVGVADRWDALRRKLSID